MNDGMNDGINDGTQDGKPASLDDSAMALARRFVAAHPPRGEVLLCAVTGSHIYGFSSPDSDIDLKGVHQVPTRDLLGFTGVAETHDRLQVFEGTECDLTTHELRKALALLLAGNGNMLERFESPIQLYQSPVVDAMRHLSEGARSTRFVRHYAGFFKGMCREHERSAAPRAKTLLYCYRVALTGAHLLLTGELECDLRRLAPLHGFGEALELVAYKANAHETAAVPAEVDARHRASWPRLEAFIDAAKARSPLPAAPANEAACEAWLVERRMMQFG